jgi:hypothetical protein
MCNATKLLVPIEKAFDLEEGFAAMPIDGTLIDRVTAWRDIDQCHSDLDSFD